MPEGHSLHRLARDLQELVGQELRASSPQGRFDAGALDGATLDVAWDLIAPSTCELLTDEQVDELRATLGPDPLGPDPDRDRALELLRASGTTIGEALLDQSLVAGVGNVFRAEALVRIHVDPRTPAADLTDEQYRTLWDVLTTMMKQAVDDAEIRPKLVYKQATCLQCAAGVPVESFDLRGRTAYRCPRCQP